MSASTGRRTLAGLAPSLVPSGRGSQAAAAGMLAALAAVTAVAAAPGDRAVREGFWLAVTVARAHGDDAYSRAFLDTAWSAIDQLRDATEGTYR